MGGGVTRSWLVVLCVFVGCGGGAGQTDGGRDTPGSSDHAGDMAPAGDAPGDGLVAVDGAADVPAADAPGDTAPDVPAGDAPEGGAPDVPAGDGSDASPDGNDASPDASDGPPGDTGGSDTGGVCEVVRTLSASQSLAYAPMAIGDRWTYQGRSWLTSFPQYPVEYQQRLEVTGTKTINGVEAFVVNDSSPDGNPTPADEYFAVTAAGLVNEGLAATGNPPPTGWFPAAPYVEVPFPVRVCSAFQKFQMTGSSGKATGTSVARAVETTAVSGMSFPDALRMEENVTIETAAPDGGAPVVRPYSSTVDWYAPGFGRIKRTVNLSDREYHYDITGALIGGVGHGVLPGGNIAQLDVISSFLGSSDRPAVASDGQRFLVVSSTSTDLYVGGLAAILVGPDGKTIKTTPIVQGGRVPTTAAVAYGDGRYLVAYPTWNSTIKAVMLSSDGTQMGSAFDIWGGGSVAVAYGKGVFLVASNQSASLGISVVSSQGAVTSEAIPYPGQQQQGAPALAFDGKNFLMAWLNTTSELPNGLSKHVSAGRVNADGNAIDVAITQVTTAPPLQVDVDVAFDGTRYVVAWGHAKFASEIGANEVRIARIGTDGVLLDPGGRVIAPARGETGKANPRITRLGSQTLVVWRRTNYQERGPSIWIAGTRVDADGNSLDSSATSDGLFISGPSSSETILPAVAWSGDRALLVYIDRGGESMMKRKLDASLVFPW